ncbi:hypothetical protein [Halomicrococcus sp. SG-WS-1]|uniref:hypothetical protein n=1 Tax=Halomicrococcus sp. SG-WS-1 TaxID=3439057 RepID=UPI003F78D3C6
MSISELIPNAQTASTATTDTTPEFRLDERYTITPGSTKRVGSIKHPDQTGHVKITTELDTNVTTERWIAIPTTYIWTLDIRPNGTLSWARTGIE